jgi:hypothetical protein
MSEEFNFQNELKSSIFNADDKVNKKELLEDIFKSYVAKLFEKVITGKRLPFDALVEVKGNLIREFRATDLSEYQRTVEQYEELFDTTVKEILSFAASQHDGRDSAIFAPQELVINPRVYVNEGGLMKPIDAM